MPGAVADHTDHEYESNIKGFCVHVCCYLEDQGGERHRYAWSCNDRDNEFPHLEDSHVAIQIANAQQACSRQVYERGMRFVGGWVERFDREAKRYRKVREWSFSPTCYMVIGTSGGDGPERETRSVHLLSVCRCFERASAGK